MEAHLAAAMARAIRDHTWTITAYRPDASDGVNAVAAETTVEPSFAGRIEATPLRKPSEQGSRDALSVDGTHVLFADTDGRNIRRGDYLVAVDSATSATWRFRVVRADNYRQLVLEVVQ
jgi:hypothetical protein